MSARQELEALLQEKAEALGGRDRRVASHLFSLRAQEGTAGGINRARIRAIQDAWHRHAAELREAGVPEEEIERARIGPFS